MAQEEKKAPPSSFALWLEEALPGWILPVAGIGSAGGIAGSYFLGWITDHTVAMILTGVFVAVLAVIALRAAFSSLDSTVRAAAVALVLGTAFVALYPARMMLAPGEPIASGELSEHDTLALPGEGLYRLFVTTSLGKSSEARVSYRLKTSEGDVDGALERVYSYVRARRGGAVKVAEDRNVNLHDVRISGTPATVTLDTLSGDTTAKTVTIRAFRVLPTWVTWAVIAGLVLLGAWLEGRTNAKGAFSMTAMAAVVFGRLIGTGDAAAVMGPVMGSALLGAGIGAVLGSILKSVGRKFFAAPAQTTPGGSPQAPVEKKKAA